MERVGLRGWGQFRVSALRLKGRSLEEILFKNPCEPRLPLGADERLCLKSEAVEGTVFRAYCLCSDGNKIEYLNLDCVLKNSST